MCHCRKPRWGLRWHWKYTAQKEPYDAEAKQYLTQKALKLTEARWQALEDSQRAELLSKELWIRENCEVGQPMAACKSHLHTADVAHAIQSRRGIHIKRAAQ